MGKHRHLQQFYRAQLSALVATGVDYAVTAALFQLGGVDYVWSSLLGAVAGGVLNCVVNYHWTFSDTEASKRTVAMRYMVVWSGSIALNAWGVAVVARWLSSAQVVLTTLMTAKVIVTVLVGLAWNYVMQKRWVYRS